MLNWDSRYLCHFSTEMAEIWSPGTSFQDVWTCKISALYLLYFHSYEIFSGNHFKYHILAEKRTCAGQHRQNLLNKCPNMKKEHLSSLGPFFFLFLLPFFTCTVQPTCSRIKCMVLISCVHGIGYVVYNKLAIIATMLCRFQGQECCQFCRWSVG